MELICPLCNGLYTIEKRCVRCNHLMEDQGAIVNFYDEYSPYLLDDITNNDDGLSKNKCLHLFRCINCEFEYSYDIDIERF